MADVKLTVEYQPVTDTSQIRQKIQADINAASKESYYVPLKFNTKALDDSVKAIRKSASSLSGVFSSLQSQADDTVRRVQAIMGEIDKLNSKKANLNSNISDIETSVYNIENKLNGIDGKEFNANVVVTNNIDSVIQDINGLDSRLQELERTKYTITINDDIGSALKQSADSLTKFGDSFDDLKSKISSIADVVGNQDIMGSFSQMANNANSSIDNIKSNLEALLNVAKGFGGINIKLNIGRESSAVTRANAYRDALAELETQAHALEDELSRLAPALRSGISQEGKAGDVSAVANLLSQAGIKDWWELLERYGVDKAKLDVQVDAMRNYVNAILEAANIKGVDLSGVTSQFDRSADQIVEDAKKATTGAKDFGNSIDKVSGLLSPKMDTSNLESQMETLAQGMQQVASATQGISSETIEAFTGATTRAVESVESLLGSVNSLNVSMGGLGISELTTSIQNSVEVIRECIQSINTLNESLGSIGTALQTDGINSAFSTMSDAIASIKIDLASLKDTMGSFINGDSVSGEMAKIADSGQAIGASTTQVDAFATALSELRTQAEALEQAFAMVRGMQNGSAAASDIINTSGIMKGNELSAFIKQVYSDTGSLQEQAARWQSYINMMVDAANSLGYGLEISVTTSQFTRTADEIMADATKADEGARKFKVSIEEINNTSVQQAPMTSLREQIDSIVQSLQQMSTATQAINPDAFNTIVASLTGLTQALSNMPTEGLMSTFTQISEAIASVKTDLASLKTAMGSFTNGETISGEMMKITESGKALEAGVSQVQTSLTNIANYEQIKTQFDAISEAIDRVAASLGTMDTDAMSQVKVSIDNVLQSVSALVEGLSQLQQSTTAVNFGDFGATITECAAHLKTMAETLSSISTSLGNGNFFASFGELSGVIKGIQTDLTSLYETVKMVGGVDDAGKGSTLLENTSNATTAVNELKAAFGSLTNEQLPAQLESVNKSIQGISDAINTVSTGSMEKFSSMIKTATDAVNNLSEAAARLSRTEFHIDTFRLDELINKLAELLNISHSGAFNDIQRGNDVNADQLARSYDRVAESAKNAGDASTRIVEALGEFDTSKIKDTLMQLDGMDESSATKFAAALSEANVKVNTLETNWKESADHAQSLLNLIVNGTNELGQSVIVTMRYSRATGELIDTHVKLKQQIQDIDEETQKLASKATEQNNALNRYISLYYKASNLASKYDVSGVNTDQGKQALININQLVKDMSQYGEVMKNSGVDVDDLNKRMSEFNKTLTENSGILRQNESDSKSSVRSEIQLYNAQKSYMNLLSKVQGAIHDYSAAQNSNNAESRDAYQGLQNTEAQMLKYESAVRDGAVSLQEIRRMTAEYSRDLTNNANTIQANGDAHRTFGQMVGKVTKEFARWFSGSRVILYIVRALRNMIKTTIELDDALTQMQVVTHASESSLNRFADSAAEAAKKVGASVTDFINSATVFARLGYNMDESSTLAQITNMLSNVGDIEVSDAQDAMTAIIKAFDVDISDVETVADELVKVGNNFPISVEEIAEGMNNASSTLAAAGNSFEQSVALLTAANVTVRNCRVA